MRIDPTRRMELHLDDQTRALAEVAAEWLIAQGHEVKPTVNYRTASSVAVRLRGRKQWTCVNSRWLVNIARREGWAGGQP